MMPTPIALLLEATERGFKLEAHGNQLHIIPVDPATRCPPDFMETLRQTKPWLLIMLQWPFWMVYSQTLQQRIFFCRDEDTKAGLVEAGAEPFSIYTREELANLCAQNRVALFSGEELRMVHALKKTFHGKIRLNEN